MPALTNISGMRRALPLINKRYVEFVPGESKDFPDADWAAIKDRVSVKGHFTVAGAMPAAAPSSVTLSGDIKSDGSVTVEAPKPARAKKG